MTSFHFLGPFVFFFVEFVLRAVMSIPRSGEIDGLVIPNNCCAKKREKIIIDTDPGIGKFV